MGDMGGPMGDMGGPMGDMGGDMGGAPMGDMGGDMGGGDMGGGAPSMPPMDPGVGAQPMPPMDPGQPAPSTPAPIDSGAPASDPNTPPATNQTLQGCVDNANGTKTCCGLQPDGTLICPSGTTPPVLLSLYGNQLFLHQAPQYNVIMI